MQTNKRKSIEVTLIKEDVLYIHLVANTEVTFNDSALAVEEMGMLSQGKKFPVFIDVSDFCNIDKEVRLFSTSEDNSLSTLADAIAYKNLGQKLILDFYIKENKPSVPKKIIYDKQEAILLLQTFLKEKNVNVHSKYTN